MAISANASRIVSTCLLRRYRRIHDVFHVILVLWRACAIFRCKIDVFQFLPGSCVSSFFLGCFVNYLWIFKVQFAGETKDDEVQSQSASLGHRGSGTWNPATWHDATVGWSDDVLVTMTPWYDAIVIPFDTSWYHWSPRHSSFSEERRQLRFAEILLMACLTVHNAVVFYVAQAWRAQWRQDS